MYDDIILCIISNFSKILQEDVLILCKIMPVSKKFCAIIKLYLKNLIDFHKNMLFFESLGHKEAVLSGKLEICQYIHNKYKLPKCWNNLLFRIACDLEFFDICDFICNFIESDKNLFQEVISSGKYEYMIKMINKYNYIKVDSFWIWISDNVKIIKYYEEVNDKIDPPDLRIIIGYSKMNSLKYAIEKYGINQLDNLSYNPKDIDIFKYLWSLKPKPNCLNDLINTCLVHGYDEAYLYIKKLADSYNVNIKIETSNYYPYHDNPKMLKILKNVFPHKKYNSVVKKIFSDYDRFPNMIIYLCSFEQYISYIDDIFYNTMNYELIDFCLPRITKANIFITEKIKRLIDKNNIKALQILLCGNPLLYNIMKKHRNNSMQFLNM